MPESWCAVCNTRHASRGECPGELLVSEPERHGWRVLVHTGGRTEVYGVLVAPTGDRWRSRILTYPNILWTVPGGGGSIKFAGRTAEEAERRAIAFIEEHCLAKNFRRRDQLDPVEVRRISEEAGPRSRPRCHQASKRKTCFLQVRFGTERARRKGTTVNLSWSSEDAVLLQLTD